MLWNSLRTVSHATLDSAILANRNHAQAQLKRTFCSHFAPVESVCELVSQLWLKSAEKRAKPRPRLALFVHLLFFLLLALVILLTTCTGELRRKMACEKCIRQDPFSKGAIPTHPSVANPSPTQPERGRILHPSAGRVVRDDKLM